MKKPSSTMVVWLVLGLAFGLAGCSGDDENPVAAAPADDTMTIDGSTAEDFSVQALEVVNSMIADIPAIATGDFSGWAASKANLNKANGDDVEWDPAQNAWVFSYDGPLMETAPPSYWNFSLDLWVQYRNADGPLQYALGATEMELRYGTGMDMHLVGDEGTADLNYEMSSSLVVGYLGDGDRYSVVGTGDTVVEVSNEGPQGSESGSFAMDWAMDIEASDAGCPSGTATVNAQQFRLDAVYDGQGNVNWTLVGPNYQATGSDVLMCGETLY